MHIVTDTSDMKIKFRSFPAARIIVGLAIFPFALLSAIESPPDTSKPPAAMLSAEQAERESAAKLPFLGLSTAIVPDIVADHLGLRTGSGLIVRSISPDSPAEKAGLSENEIIVSIDGTVVGDPDEFSSRIRKYKAGDSIDLGIIRKGKPHSVKVTLCERPAELEAHLSPEPFMQGSPQGQADLRKMMERNLLGLGMDPFGIAPHQEFENTFRMLRQQMNRAFDSEIPPITQGEDGGVHFQQNSTVRLMDNQGSVEIKSSEGDTQVTVRDTANAVVWQGPWNSDNDKEAAPQDVRERIDQVNVGSANGKGFTFRFGKSNGKPDTIDN